MKNIKYKNIFLLLLVLVMLLSLSCCSADNTERVVKPAGEDVNIIFASDLHYLSPSLNDNGELFTKVMDNADGKMTAYSEEIVDKFIDEVIEASPDYLVLTGDLTFNGEKKSLQDLKKKLLRVKEKGIDVLAIYGNHDIESSYAYRYSGSNSHECANISEKYYKKSFGEFGYDNAVSRDYASFSYIYRLADDLWILFLDANTISGAGSIRDVTLVWAEEQLKYAQDNGIKVITATHQNMLAQCAVMNSGYVINNHMVVSNMLRKYDVNYNFSGHSHIQNSVQVDGLTDVCVGSLTVSPLAYDVVNVDSSRNISLSVKKLDFMQEEAKSYFYQINRSKMEKAFVDVALDDTVKKEMIDFAMDVNYLTFAGEIEEHQSELLNSNAYKLWTKYGKDSSWYSYFECVLNNKN